MSSEASAASFLRLDLYLAILAHSPSVQSRTDLASATNLGTRSRSVAFCGIAIALPPVETADQLAHLIAQR